MNEVNTDSVNEDEHRQGYIGLDTRFLSVRNEIMDSVGFDADRRRRFDVEFHKCPLPNEKNIAAYKSWRKGVRALVRMKIGMPPRYRPFQDTMLLQSRSADDQDTSETYYRAALRVYFFDLEAHIKRDWDPIMKAYDLENNNDTHKRMTVAPSQRLPHNTNKLSELNTEYDNDIDELCRFPRIEKATLADHDIEKNNDTSAHTHQRYTPHSPRMTATQRSINTKESHMTHDSSPEDKAVVNKEHNLEHPTSPLPTAQQPVSSTTHIFQSVPISQRQRQPNYSYSFNEYNPYHYPGAPMRSQSQQYYYSPNSPFYFQQRFAQQQQHRQHIFPIEPNAPALQPLLPPPTLTTQQLLRDTPTLTTQPLRPPGSPPTPTGTGTPPLEPLEPDVIENHEPNKRRKVVLDHLIFLLEQLEMEKRLEERTRDM